MYDVLNRTLLNDTQAQLRHWQRAHLEAVYSQDAARVEDCERFIAQCESVIAGLEREHQ